MSAPDTLRSINCTSCGAGLSVLGGGRVAARGCEYCGALLDAQDNYKILEKYDKAPRPDSPISLGSLGELGDRKPVLLRVGPKPPLHDSN